MLARDLRISIRIRTEMDFFSALFPSDSDGSKLYGQAKDLAYRYNTMVRVRQGNDYLAAGKLHAVAVLHLIYQTVLTRYLSDTEPDFFTRLTILVEKNHACQDVLSFYNKEFPSPLLNEQEPPLPFFMEEVLRGFFTHQVMEENPALLKAARPFLAPEGLHFPQGTQALTALLGGYTQGAAMMANSDEDIFSFLTRPAKLYPNSLPLQLSHIADAWADLLPKAILEMILRSIDFITEEDKPRFSAPKGGNTVTTVVPDYSTIQEEYEAFSVDRNWMPNVVMMAKSTLVWLDQLSKQYGKTIETLDEIPDRELDLLSQRGFTALWLIGLWERSPASKRIKNLCGNPDAEASAYSLKNYEIAASIGGWPALDDLRRRCADRGIRLASDMVPNHCGIDGDWVFDHSQYFIQQDHPPFPSYTYNGPNLSNRPDIEIKLEDHYYDRSDAAVTFFRKDLKTGRETYIFHGNDGTSMPWNDTAQLDFLNPETREAVFQEIKHVAENFPIIRFDAAMTLAKKHIQRLWYPSPGNGGAIAGRTESGLSDARFNAALPREFWRDVVDRLKEELPDTLLLAEAFWMMEGYFVRTLGMHRVYNSAFMNMLKNEENEKYRDTIRNTLEFEPEILKRFVNFMNNPDEETAVTQFGDGDKYFGVCTLLSTMPGLPMFGHGQLEGYREKYGMEYRRAYWNEKPDSHLLEQHERRIYPLLKRRYLFSGIEYFDLFDLVDDRTVRQSAFCYVNGTEQERAMVLYNNQYESVSGTIKDSVPRIRKNGKKKQGESHSLAESLGLTLGGRQYLLMESFPDGATFLRPSIRIFDEGLFLHLNGYETRVFLHIHEEEDVDGVYEHLHAAFGDEGISDIARRIATLRLEPIYKAMESLAGSSCRKLIGTMLRGEATVQDERKVLLILAEAYTHLNAVVETLHPVTKTALPREPMDMDPQTMMQEVKRLSGLFSKEAKTSYFRQGASIMEELPTIIAATMFLKPFIGKESHTVKKAMAAADKLLLYRFFAKQLAKEGRTEEESRKVCHQAAIVAAAAKVKHKPKDDPISILSSLLADEAIARYVNVNTYRGVSWYRKESMQELIYLSALSFGIEDARFDAETYVSVLMAGETAAKYRLDALTGHTRQGTPSV